MESNPLAIAMQRKVIANDAPRVVGDSPPRRASLRARLGKIKTRGKKNEHSR